MRRAPEIAEACGRLAPYLAPLLPELGLPALDAGEATLIEALRRAFAEMASCGPAAVVLDDLHWADEATLLLLPRIAPGLRDVPLLLVAIARDEVPADTHRLRRLRGELRRVSEPLELPLRPLERADTALLAAAVTGEELADDIVDVLHDRSHGIPFYVEQIASTLRRGDGHADADARPLPETLIDAVLLRTEALSLPARNALERAAVVGQRSPVDHGTGSVGGDALAEALAAGFLVDAGPAHVEFRHALVRDAIYEAIPWTRRRSLHAAIARSLETAAAGASERAVHWLGAGDVARARSRARRGRRRLRERLRLSRRRQAVRAGARPRRRHRAAALRAARAPRDVCGARRRPRRIRARLARGHRRPARPWSDRAGRRGPARARARARAPRQLRARARSVVGGRGLLHGLRTARGRRPLAHRDGGRPAGRRQPAPGARGGDGRDRRHARRRTGGPPLPRALARGHAAREAGRDPARARIRARGAVGRARGRAHGHGGGRLPGDRHRPRERRRIRGGERGLRRRDRLLRELGRGDGPGLLRGLPLPRPAPARRVAPRARARPHADRRPGGGGEAARDRRGRDEPGARAPRRAPARPAARHGGRARPASVRGPRRGGGVLLDVRAPRRAGGRLRGRPRALSRHPPALGGQRGPALQPERAGLVGRPLRRSRVRGRSQPRRARAHGDRCGQRQPRGARDALRGARRTRARRAERGRGGRALPARARRCIRRSSSPTIAPSCSSGPPRPRAIPATPSSRASGSPTRVSRRGGSGPARCSRPPRPRSPRSVAGKATEARAPPRA